MGPYRLTVSYKSLNCAPKNLPHRRVRCHWRPFTAPKAWKPTQYISSYLIGLAEEVLPSWHSINKGNGCIALEEERRACFVAITRTRKQLILSRASRYNGWLKEPSRFLQEMCNLNDGAGSTSDYVDVAGSVSDDMAVAGSTSDEKLIMQTQRVGIESEQ